MIRTFGIVLLVYSDGSHSGYGGDMVEHGCQVVNGLWTAEEASQSSKWHELRAVHLILEVLNSKLRNERVRWFTDNQNVANILTVGSRKGNLQIRYRPEVTSYSLTFFLEWRVRLDSVSSPLTFP